MTRSAVPFLIVLALVLLVVTYGPLMVSCRRGSSQAERIDAARNDYLVGNVVFALRKRSLAASDLNG